MYKSIFILRLAAIIVGLAMAGIGGWMAAVGYAHDDSSHKREPRYEVPHASKLVRETSSFIYRLPPEYREHLNIDETWMLYPLGGGGALIFFVGLVIFLNGAFRRFSSRAEKGAVIREEDSRISDDLIPFAPKTPKPASPGAGAISIDEGALDVVEDESEKMRDINYIVTISQAALAPETVALVIRNFRPDLEKYLPLFNETGGEKLAHQVLGAVILRHRRHSREITADQFQSQDTRIIEWERAAFCHRYMPPQAKIASDDIRKNVGKVYDSYERSVIQKQVAGEADDWRDISLRNALEVLSAKTALEEDAAADSPPAQTAAYGGDFPPRSD